MSILYRIGLFGASGLLALQMLSCSRGTPIEKKQYETSTHTIYFSPKLAVDGECLFENIDRYTKERNIRIYALLSPQQEVESITVQPREFGQKYKTEIVKLAEECEKSIQISE